jgi:hypothetical protein
MAHGKPPKPVMSRATSIIPQLLVLPPDSARPMMHQLKKRETRVTVRKLSPGRPCKASLATESIRDPRCDNEAN